MIVAEVTNTGMALGVTAAIILGIGGIVMGLFISAQYVALKSRVDVLDDRMHSPLPPARATMAEADTDQFPAVEEPVSPRPSPSPRPRPQPEQPPTVPETEAIDAGQARLEKMMSEAMESIDAIARGEK